MRASIEGRNSCVRHSSRRCSSGRRHRGGGRRGLDRHRPEQLAGAVRAPVPGRRPHGLAAHRRRLRRRLPDGRDPGRPRCLREPAGHVHRADEPRDRAGAGHRPRPRCERRFRLAVGRQQKEPRFRGRDATTSSGSRPGTRRRARTTRPRRASPSAVSARPTCRLARLSTTSTRRLATSPALPGGEEVGNEGRAFAHAEGGISWERPRSASSPSRTRRESGTGRKTVVSAPTTPLPPARCTSMSGRRRRPATRRSGRA